MAHNVQEQCRLEENNRQRENQDGAGKRATLPSLFDGVARQHSRKPDEFYAMVDRCTLAGRRADVFSREARPGWECWGHEAGKFDAGVEVR